MKKDEKLDKKIEDASNIDINSLVAKKVAEALKAQEEAFNKKLEKAKEETNKKIEETSFKEADLDTIRNRNLGIQEDKASIKFEIIESLKNGSLEKTEVIKIKALSRSNEIVQKITLDLVLKKNEFAEEFANYFKQKYAKQKDKLVGFSTKVEKMLVSRGILTNTVLQKQTKSFLYELISSVYGEAGYIEILKELEGK